ncbi:MAG TPA: serine/threonine-protein kinase [Polyangiaceae bacterium]|nr:serine/threonine-protein kinase [Polyangiaceae bacterium]
MTEPTNKRPPSPRPRPAVVRVGDPSAKDEKPLEATLAPTTEELVGLKVVTIAPGTISYSDAEVTNSQVARMRQDPYLGATIDGRYKVEALLGEGGMGVVYRCVHTIIGKKVAMKVLRADLARDAEVTERFLNEAKAASSIGNAHIIDISDFGQFPDGAAYFVMEYLNGQPMSKLVEGSQPLPVQRILHLARQIAEGLSAAHAANIVHRDLKPDNIFLVDRGGQRDFVKILDFGIAKVSSSAEGSKLTRAGAVFGTPHYMSPEQAAGQPVDHRGDIYSFGVILYELASGRLPFDADNFMGILTQHMYKAPVPIRALVPVPQDVPPGLEAIILKCLSKRAEHRYQSMQELILEFDTMAAGGVPDAVPEMMARSGGFNVPVDYFKKGQMPQPVPATPSLHPRARRSRWPVYAGVAGVLAAIGIVVGIFAKSGSSAALQTSQTSLTAENTANKAIDPSAAALAAPAAPAAPAVASKQVLLAAVPIDAHVFRDAEDLGQSPVMVTVDDGHTVDLEIRREGYATSKVTLDGSKTREVVKLDKAIARAGAAVYHPPPQPVAKKADASPPVRKPKSSIGGSEIVNPWGN